MNTYNSVHEATSVFTSAIKTYTPSIVTHNQAFYTTTMPIMKKVAGE